MELNVLLLIFVSGLMITFKLLPHYDIITERNMSSHKQLNSSIISPKDLHFPKNRLCLSVALCSQK